MSGLDNNMDLAPMFHFGKADGREDNDLPAKHMGERHKQVSGNGLVFRFSANRKMHHA